MYPHQPLNGLAAFADLDSFLTDPPHVGLVAVELGGDHCQGGYGPPHVKETLVGWLALLPSDAKGLELPDQLCARSGLKEVETGSASASSNYEQQLSQEGTVRDFPISQQSRRLQSNDLSRFPRSRAKTARVAYLGHICVDEHPAGTYRIAGDAAACTFERNFARKP